MQVQLRHKVVMQPPLIERLCSVRAAFLTAITNRTAHQPGVARHAGSRVQQNRAALKQAAHEPGGTAGKLLVCGSRFSCKSNTQGSALHGCALHSTSRWNLAGCEPAATCVALLAASCQGTHAGMQQQLCMVCLPACLTEQGRQAVNISAHPHLTWLCSGW